MLSKASTCSVIDILKPNSLRLTAMFILFFCCLSSAEQRIDHLYEARIPLQSRDAGSQQAAMQEGLASVLTKISGYSGTADFPELVNELQKADSMLSEFGLQSIELPASDDITSLTADALYMRFVSSQVDQLVRRYEIPVWPANRADILFLVTVELGGSPRFLTESTHPAIFAYLKQAAFDRGFGLRLLSRTELDSLQISANPVWFLQKEAFEPLHSRIPTDKIAVVRLRPGQLLETTNKGFIGLAQEQEKSDFGDLSVMGQGLEFQEPLQAESLIEALRHSLDTYLDQLSLETAFVASATLDTQVSIEVSGVPDFDAYRRVRDYIQSLEQVERFKLVRLSMDRMVLQVEFQSGIELLNSRLLGSGFLSSAGGGVTAASELQYRYILGLVVQ